MIDKDITTAILGAKGSGKTVLLASMLHNYNDKAILFDTLGVLNPRNKFKTAVIPRSYYCINGESFLENIDKFPSKAKIVVSLEDYINNDIIDIVDSISKELMNRKENIALLSDEIADIMPNNAKGSTEFHRLVKNGRNYGIKPVVFATQRPQSVSKAIFDLCDKFYISTQRAPRTVDYILDILDTTGDDNMKQTITGLQHREFLIYDGANIKKYKVPYYKYSYSQ